MKEEKKAKKANKGRKNEKIEEGITSSQRVERQNPIQSWDSSSVRSRVGIRATWLRGRYRVGHRPVVLLRTETAQCTVRPK